MKKAPEKQVHREEYEMRFLDILSDSNRVAVDVGANIGSFSDRLLDLCSHLYVYEPLPDLGKSLKLRYKTKKNVTVRTVALSNKNGNAEIHTPQFSGWKSSKDGFVSGWSSIAKDYGDLQKKYPDKFPTVKSTKIETVTLDDEKIDNVGFIKIDVEGFELEVLKGGRKTIVKNQPVLLIEIEERHKKGNIKRVSNYLKGLGYQGYFFIDEKLQPIGRFSIPKMQTGKIFPGPIDTTKYKHYIYNFIFLPKLTRNDLLKKINNLLPEVL